MNASNCDFYISFGSTVSLESSLFSSVMSMQGISAEKHYNEVIKLCCWFNVSVSWMLALDDPLLTG